MSLPKAVLGVLLAGGKSSRMGGGDKCLMPLAGAPMLSHVVGRLRPQVTELILNANGDLAALQHSACLSSRIAWATTQDPLRASTPQFIRPKPIDQKANSSLPRRRTRHSSPLIWWPGFYQSTWEVSQGCWLPDRTRACIRSLGFGPSSSGRKSKSRLRVACAKFKPGQRASSARDFLPQDGNRRPQHRSLL